MAVQPKSAAQIQAEIRARSQGANKPALTAAIQQEVAKTELPYRRYFSRSPHSRFIFEDNFEALFVFGKLDIGEGTHPGIFQAPDRNKEPHPKNGRPRYQVYQEELDAILGRQNNIFVPEAIPAADEIPDQNAATAATVQASDRIITAGAHTAAQEVGKVEARQPSRADIDKSAVDTRLFDSAASQMQVKSVS